MIGKWKVRRARKEYLKTVKDLREGKIDLEQVISPSICGELVGTTEGNKKA